MTSSVLLCSSHPLKYFGVKEGAVHPASAYGLLKHHS